jgi:LysM repeat protein
MMCLPAVRCLSALLLFSFFGSDCSPVSKGKSDEEKDPDFIAGKARLNSLDYRGAVEAFEKALERNPHSASAHFELGLVCYQYVNEYAGAIYHFRKFLELRPNAPHAENVSQFINVCKQELAKGVPLAPITRKMQQDLEMLASENLRLKQQIDFLSKSLFDATNRLRSVPPAGFINNDRTQTFARVSLAAPRTVTPLPAPVSAAKTSVRRHLVKRHETLTSIARQYRISLPRILAANPGLNPNRLKVGQVLNIPSS